jgi:hypothetical protein
VNVLKLKLWGDEFEFDGQKDKVGRLHSSDVHLSSWQIYSQLLSEASLDCTDRVLADSETFLTYRSDDMMR